MPSKNHKLVELIKVVDDWVENIVLHNRHFPLFYKHQFFVCSIWYFLLICCFDLISKYYGMEYMAWAHCICACRWNSKSYRTQARREPPGNWDLTFSYVPRDTSSIAGWGSANPAFCANCTACLRTRILCQELDFKRSICYIYNQNKPFIFLIIGCKITFEIHVFPL